MSPADGDAGGFGPRPAMEPAPGLSCPEAIMLPGGQALLLLLSRSEAPPTEGRLASSRGDCAWTAVAWPSPGGWAGLALAPASHCLAGGEIDVLTGAGAPAGRLAPPERFGLEAQALVDHVAATKGDGRTVFGFLRKALLGDRPAAEGATAAYVLFLQRFLTAAAAQDGFIEIVSAPEGGGLFAQGWAMSLPAGRLSVVVASADLTVCEIDAARFARDDILPPGGGVCLFAPRWTAAEAASLRSIVFEHGERLLRLDVVADGPVRLDADAGLAHMRRGLQRLTGPDVSLRAFRRACRPRFAGEDTLSGSALPVACALDALWTTDGGGVLALGWLLDPLGRIERALVKSDTGLYVELHKGWVRQPRPDVAQGFAADPRFAGLLDRGEDLHGFIASAQVDPARLEGARLYLELILDDETCLFRPLSAVRVGLARPRAFLPPLDVDQAEADLVVERHLAPFVATLPRRLRDGAGRSPEPIVLAEGEPRPVSAVVPFRRAAELHPMLALLAGAPEAALTELTLVTTRAVAHAAVAQLREAFGFFGLQGRLVLAPDGASVADQLDRGVDASRGPKALLWRPTALPTAGGWLPDLLEEFVGLPGPVALSPTLIYEDGSVFFGGPADGGAEAGRDGWLGLDAALLRRCAPCRVDCAPPDVALLDRETLRAAGGVRGRLLGDRLAHVDLSARLREAGAGLWRSGRVAFWKLDDAEPDSGAPEQRLVDRIDRALAKRFAGRSSGETER